MNMNINLVKKYENGAAPVFVLRSDKRLSKHPFYRSLPEADRSLLDSYVAKNDLSKPLFQILYMPSGARVMVISVGERSKFSFRSSVLVMRRIIAAARKEKMATLQIDLADLLAKDANDPVRIAESLATQAEIANFEFVAYRTPDPAGWNFVSDIYVHAERPSKSLSGAIARGKVIGEEINASRSLANTPGGDMTPALLAKAAVAAGKIAGIKVAVLDEKEIKKLGMGGILGVSQGSDAPPRFVVMEYFGGPKKEAPVVLIGKGITFDSGGLNLKPSAHIYEMHMDMSGAAAVIHTVSALARLKVRKNVVALVPAAENMPSGSSYRPGDLLRTMSGKTIEVMDTDAEGRVVLSDALTYAQKYNPRLVIDVATLTGASMVALGQRASALFATDRKLEALFRETGERTADPVWPLPLWEEYEEEIKGTFGDWANVGKTRYGGAITGAVFLWQFIKGFPWVHLDIAPRMTTIDGEYLAKGSAGAPINLLVHVVEKY